MSDTIFDNFTAGCSANSNVTGTSSTSTSNNPNNNDDTVNNVTTSKLQTQTSPLPSSTNQTSTASAPTPTPPPPKLGLSDFELLTVIGKGGFGKVVHCRHRGTATTYAMKILSKEFLIDTNNVSYMLEERASLLKVNHPFIVKLLAAFQTTTKVYLVMEYIIGGELFSRLQDRAFFLPNEAKFYTAEAVLAIEYLHGVGICHRDLKPENCLLDKDGHLRITDFGFAKGFTGGSENHNWLKTMCGTDEYMAPEMIKGQRYGFAVDWWALGCLIFEMTTGKPPFRGKNKKKLHQDILNSRVKMSPHLTSEQCSLIKGLLCRNPEQRLGAAKSTMFKTKGVKEIKQHPFFRRLQWQRLIAKEIEPPFRPEITNQFDTSHFDEEFVVMPLLSPAISPQRAQKMLHKMKLDEKSGVFSIADHVPEGRAIEISEAPAKRAEKTLKDTDIKSNAAAAASCIKIGKVLSSSISSVPSTSTSSPPEELFGGFSWQRPSFMETHMIAIETDDTEVELPELPKSPLSRASRTPSPAGQTKPPSPAQKLAASAKKKRRKQQKKEEKEKIKEERKQQEKERIERLLGLSTGTDDKLHTSTVTIPISSKVMIATSTPNSTPTPKVTLDQITVVGERETMASTEDNAGIFAFDMEEEAISGCRVASLSTESTDPRLKAFVNAQEWAPPSTSTTSSKAIPSSSFSKPSGPRSLSPGNRAFSPTAPSFSPTAPAWKPVSFKSQQRSTTHPWGKATAGAAAAAEGGLTTNKILGASASATSVSKDNAKVWGRSKPTAAAQTAPVTSAPITSATASSSYLPSTSSNQQSAPSGWTTVRSTTARTTRTSRKPGNNYNSSNMSSTSRPKPDSTPEEKRYDEGSLFTKKEFMSYYGFHSGMQRWNNASAEVKY